MKTLNRMLHTPQVCVMLLLLSHLANADSQPYQNVSPWQVESITTTAPYTLDLSLTKNFSLFDAPYFTINLSNPTQHTLVFRWDNPHAVTFTVEYKSARSSLDQDDGWIPVLPKVQLPPDANHRNNLRLFGLHQHLATYNIRIQVLPGQTDSSLCFPPDINMSKVGFYRVKAVMTVADAVELDGSPDSPTTIRKVELVIHSKPLIIRHITSGFVPVDAASVEEINHE